MKKDSDIFKKSLRCGIAYEIISYGILLICGFFVSKITESAILENWHAMFLFAVAAVVLLAGGSIALYFLNRRYESNTISEKFDFREFLYHSLILRRMKTETPGCFEVNMSNDTEAISKYMQRIVPQFVSNICIVICSIVLAFTVSWETTLIFIAISLLQLLPVIVYERWAVNIYNETDEHDEDYSEWIIEGLNGASDIRSYRAEKWYLKRYRSANEGTLYWGSKAEKTQTVEKIISNAIESLQKYGSILIMGAFSIWGIIDISKLPFLIVLSEYIYSSVGFFISYRLQKTEYREAYKRLKLSKETYRSESCDTCDKLVQLEKISKSYGDKNVLMDTDFSVKRGEKILLIGKNGSGKSTLIKIILGLEDASVADYMSVLDKEDISYSLQEYPQMNIAAQDVIDCVNSNCSVNKDLLKTCFEGFCIDTILKKSMCDMSPGERKKVLLSLALAKESKLLIMDEPTNHLDAKSVAFLYRFLSNREQALILCTHDNNSELSFDRVVTMKGGKCYERKAIV